MPTGERATHQEPRRCLTHRGKELGDNMPQGMRRAKGGKEGTAPEKATKKAGKGPRS